MQNTRYYLLTLLLTLLFASCQKDSSNTPSDTREIEIELTMPEAASLDAIPYKLHYYWQIGDLINLRIQAGGQETTLQQVAPKLSSDGLRATIKVTLPTGMPTSGLTIQGEVVDKPSTTPTLIAYTAPLPSKEDKNRFNLRKSGIKGPLYINQSGLSASNGTISLQLSTVGYFSLIEFYNQSTNPYKLPKELTLTSNTPWLRQTREPAYDYTRHTFRGEKNQKELPLTTHEQTLRPKENYRLLLWLPEKPTNTAIKIKDNAPQGQAIPFEQELSIAYTKEGVLALVPGLLTPTPADTSRGGDPYFTFDDIQYWIGSGSKRVALLIDWHLKGEQEALVWGYRFDGEKSTGDMLEEIANSDPRLYLAIGQSGSFGGFVLFGIAYQTKPTAQPLQIIYKEKPLTLKSRNVFFINANGDDKKAPDLLTITDPTAKWQHGWLTNGYWAYLHKDTRLAKFGYSSTGMWTTDLKDNSWHALCFSSLTNGSQKGDNISPTFTPAPTKK